MERYEEYKDSGVEWIGEIPAGWEVGRIRGLYQQRKESVLEGDAEELLSVSEYYGVDYRKNRIGEADVLSRAETLEGYQRCESGDLIMNIMLAWKGAQGTSQVSGLVSPSYGVYAPLEGASPRYYHYLYRTDQYKDYFRNNSTGIIDSRLRLYPEAFLHLTCHVPPLQDQQAIADYLDEKTVEIDGLVADCEREVELLQEYRKAVISEAVTKGLDPNAPMKDSGIEWIGQIPKRWSCENLGGHSWMLTPMRDKPEDLSGPIPWIRIEDYDGKYISSSKEELGVSAETVSAMNLKVYPVGTLLCTSSCDLGKCAIVAKELVSNQRFIGIIPVDYSIDFLYYLMLSNAERLNFLSTGTIQANLSRKAFEHLKLPYPPFSEQVEIAAYLDTKTAEIDSLIEDKLAMADKLREYRKSLISEAVTGKFKVPGV